MAERRVAENVLVMGASPDASRYANKAVRSLIDHHHHPVPFGRRKGDIAGVAITEILPQPGAVDTVSLYLGPDNQTEYFDPIIALGPRRVIFNPGTENPQFYKLLEEKGIEVVEGCTLVMLSIGTF